MSDEQLGGFAAGVGPWAGKVGLARDAVRQELVRRQLAAHLPAQGRALDVGCGQATQAIGLARHGLQVTGVDPSSDLLALATATLEAESPEVRGRVALALGELSDLPSAADGPFDVVCCHGVVMYLPSLSDAVGALAAKVASGGVLSVLSRNRAGIALRAGMSGDWQGAVAGIGASTYRNRLGLDSVRADDPEEVIGAFEGAGLEVVAWHGVRLLTDHWDDVPVPSDLDEIVQAEEALGAIDPYRRVAALTHVIGVRRP
jgi:SAM-dependent methyltransferase